VTGFVSSAPFWLIAGLVSPSRGAYILFMQTCIFNTDLGEFGIGWSDAGIARLQLPGLDRSALEERINGNGGTPGEPDRRVHRVINCIEDYATGEKVDFFDTPLDLSGLPDFHRRAYALLIGVGYGQTVTYVGLSRAVGQAMGANPIPLIIPCHRVLASDGKPGGFSAPGGSVSKLRMLALEGVFPGAPAGQMHFGF
jgi:methylated-DNA-[protein]-cysteine S-methyltransferase